MVRRNKKKNSKGKLALLIIVVALLSAGAAGAVGYLSTGYTNWKLDEWKEKVIPQVETTETSIVDSQEVQ